VFLLPDVGGKDILDAGCGPGWYTDWLARNGGRVVAIDCSPHGQAGGRRSTNLQEVAVNPIERQEAMARWMWDAHKRRESYSNLPGELRPHSSVEAYAAQEAYYRLAEPERGAVAGAKIATATKVMQQLMGITHPCSGAIFAHTIHASPARLRTADFVNLRIECEIALKLYTDIPASNAPWSRDAVAQAVACAMPAFELIEDRNADYSATEAYSLIVDNCWNGGVVIGAPLQKTVAGLTGISGKLTIGGEIVHEGKSEDPYATLAWIANHFAERGRDLKAGMVVITGSIIPTVTLAKGERAVFAVDELGEAVVDAV
jgi:2-keto-4-pentenoate hydratase